MRKILSSVGFLAVLNLLVVVLAFGIKDPDPGKQIVLMFDHRDVLGHYVVTTRAQPVVEMQFIRDISDPTIEQLAPLERNALMVCHMFTRDQHIWFRCGNDEFQMRAINFTQEER